MLPAVGGVSGVAGGAVTAGHDGTKAPPSDQLETRAGPGHC